MHRNRKRESSDITSSQPEGILKVCLVFSLPRANSGRSFGGFVAGLPASKVISTTEIRNREVGAAGRRYALQTRARQPPAGRATRSVSNRRRSSAGSASREQPRFHAPRQDIRGSLHTSAPRRSPLPTDLIRIEQNCARLLRPAPIHQPQS